MSGPTVYHGVCQGGPKDRQTLSDTTTRVPGSAGGFYVYAPPKGPTPSGWRWVEQKQGTKQ